jgi:Mn2+/Fe2+ NRAMP family transporter
MLRIINRTPAMMTHTNRRYTQAGQNYGTSLLWTLVLLIPVLYVNQETVLRLGAVTGVGHARLIIERFGKFWGAFSVIDLFMLNALTIVTEFIGIALGLSYLGVPRELGVALSAVAVMGAVSTGDFRRFERFALVLVAGSLVLVPIFLMVHPPFTEIARDMLIPQFPKEGKLSEVMLLVIAIVGTTIAPWQLFFQQSYVINKRITPRFMRYERADLWFGIVLVVIGAVAMMAFTAAAFVGRPEFGNFTDAAGVAAGLEVHAGRLPGVLFAIGLIDASLIGAAAVSLWANSRGLNLFTGAVIAVLVMLSVILTVSVLFPEKTNETVILAILAGGSAMALIAAIASGALKRRPLTTEGPKVWNREMWRMPPLSQLRPAQLSRLSKIWMIVLRGYLVLAGGLVLVRIIMLAMNN